MRAALYIRVSSEEQAIHGLSIEAQTEALEKWAEQTHVQVVDRYIDAGISARKKAYHRPALQRLLSDVRSDKIELIVFTKLDRWFRNIAEYYKVQEILEEHHVNWKTIHEDYDTSTASGRLKINIMLSVAQDEADRTSERIKAVFDSKVLRCEPISGKVPVGYRIENKRLVADPETAPVARDIFRQYVATRSINALRKYVLDKYGMAYSPTGLRMLLSNERYIGRAHGQEHFCEGIIDPDTFAITQVAIAERAQRNSSAARAGSISSPASRDVRNVEPVWPANWFAANTFIIAVRNTTSFIYARTKNIPASLPWKPGFWKTCLRSLRSTTRRLGKPSKRIPLSTSQPSGAEWKKSVTCT